MRQVLNGEPAPVGSPLRGGLARLAQTREEIAKDWLVQVIAGAPLSAAGEVPIEWATSELPELVGEILAATAEPRGSRLPDDAVERTLTLADGESPDPERVGIEVGMLQTVVLSAIRRELLGSDPELFAEAAERLAALFGPLTGATVEALSGAVGGGRDSLTGLATAASLRPRLEQLLRMYKRYGHPFSLVVFDVDSLTRENGAEGDSEHELDLATVASALREAIRSVDEGYRLESDELCMLAPGIGPEAGAQMAERLSARLSSPGVLGGRPISIAAGVAACPEHGEDPDRLLRQADTAMWRARATGRAVTVAALQDPSHSP